MVSTASLDIRDLVTGTGPFGPTEVRGVIEALGADPAAHRSLREAVRELEASGERSPAASVRLGVCQRLLGRMHDAIETLKTADGGALALFHQGLAHAAEGLHDKACELLAAARTAGYDAAACAAATAETLRKAGRLDDAKATLAGVSEANAALSADFHAARAAVMADLGAAREDILADLEKAVAIDPGHPSALFHLGVLHDRLGNDDEALACYERSLQRYPANVGTLINLGILYEDRDQFTKAQQCYRRVLEAFPDHPRARLFLPVSDFELSVRSRNCLQKMGIHTLGDLARTTEEEILASKNFGETSLVEIKDMMSSKGLSLGQLAAPSAAVAEPEPSYAEPTADEQEANALPIGELNLSVRARKCTTKLGLVTIGDLTRRTAEDLLECKNFGVTSLNEVREKLADRGLKLRGD